MLFSSITFIFLFLPIVLLLYLITKKELHNLILLIASIIFYAWGEPKYLPIIFLTILVSYIGTLLIDKFTEHKKFWLTLTILSNLGILTYFKYFNFLIDNLNNLFSTNISPLNIILPLGISFYTFQALSYVIDVYRGECKVQKNLYKLALYICLFPQLIAGPIIKYHDIENQIEHREINYEKVSLGVKRFIIGLAKKVLIANTLGAIVDKIYMQDPHIITQDIAWLGAITYPLQLYFDFSGYSDMAIGLGLIFGFEFMENFNYPYMSKSISEFWRRWHISLSTWFKQYIYIPLGGNKCSKAKNIFNLGFVFLLTGTWHGATWNFVLWGILQGFFIILEKIVNLKELEKKYTSWKIKSIQHIYCISIIVFSFVFFRSNDIQYALNYIKNMFGILPIDQNEFIYGFSYYVDKMEILIFIIAVLCSISLFKNFLSVKNKLGKICINLWLLIIFVLSVSAIAANTYNPFIYFRF